MANDVCKLYYLLSVNKLDKSTSIENSVSKQCRPGQTPRIAAPNLGPRRLQKSQSTSGLMSADFCRLLSIGRVSFFSTVFQTI